MRVGIRPKMAARDDLGCAVLRSGFVNGPKRAELQGGSWSRALAVAVI